MPVWPLVIWASGIQPLTPTMQASEDRDGRTPMATGLPVGGPAAFRAGSARQQLGTPPLPGAQMRRPQLGRPALQWTVLGGAKGPGWGALCSPGLAQELAGSRGLAPEWGAGEEGPWAAQRLIEGGAGEGAGGRGSGRVTARPPSHNLVLT